MRTSSNLWEITEHGTPLLPLTLKHSNHINNAVLIDIHQDTDDGSFPRVSDWTRFANKIDNDGVYRWINGLTRKKNKLAIDFNECKIIRDKDWQDEAIIEFNEPITVVFGKVGEELITKQVKRIKGEFTHDWFWTKHGRQERIANGVEIYFNIEEYLE